MHVFVVNLARRPDRRRRMEQILPSSWAVEYTTGWPGPLDGAAIAPGDLDDLGRFDWQIESDNAWWNRPLKLGEIGCAVSHWGCWRRAAELEADVTLVLEDDVSLVPGVERQLDRHLAALEILDRASQRRSSRASASSARARSSARASRSAASPRRPRCGASPRSAWPPARASTSVRS